MSRKFINISLYVYLEVLLGVFSLVLGPSRAYALSADNTQHFDGTPATTWAVTHSGGTLYALATLTGNVANGDPSDVTPLTTGVLSATGSCSLHVAVRHHSPLSRKPASRV